MAAGFEEILNGLDEGHSAMMSPWSKQNNHTLLANDTSNSILESVISVQDDSHLGSVMNSSSIGDNRTTGVVLDCGSITKEQIQMWLGTQYWCEGILFSIVGAVGFVGNIISIIILCTRYTKHPLCRCPKQASTGIIIMTMCFREMRKHSFNQMLLGLAFFDLMFVMCAVPVHITPIFGLENWLYATLYTYCIYPFTAISLTGSIYMTMAITIER